MSSNGGRIATLCDVALEFPVQTTFMRWQMAWLTSGYFELYVSTPSLQLRTLAARNWRSERKVLLLAIRLTRQTFEAWKHLRSGESLSTSVERWMFVGLPNASTISNFKLTDFGSDAHYEANNLMTRNDGLNMQSAQHRLREEWWSTMIGFPHPAVIVCTYMDSAKASWWIYHLAYIRRADTAVLYFNVHVVLAKFLGLEVDKLKLIPITRIVNPVTRG